jgi:glycosyltransferase involved in cell wall biosynthesis
MFREFGAVIPAYNAGDSLEAVLAGVKRYLRTERIVVVDDGSTDDTSRIAESAGVVLIRHRKNRGKGSALRSGFAHLEAQTDIEAIFTIDADGQHDPDEIPSFVEAYCQGSGDLLVGDRMGSTADMPFIRIMTNIVTSAVISIRAGCRIKDSQSGYRLIRAEVVRNVELVTERYETESEILIKAAHMGARISSVPVRTIYGTEQSTINPIADTFRFFVLVIRSIFW